MFNFFYNMSTEGLMTDYSTSCGSSPSGSAPESPKDKVKFLCSHGGKILPRPADGLLKYVGGETRIISVPREIKFQELMKKLTYLIEGDMVLKYQLVTEDLDALVTVKSDEDLSHMFEEYDRNENSGAPRLRTFLFPPKPVVLENHMEIHTLEQRYIDAINGCIRTPVAVGTKQRPVININQSSFIMSPSECASPSPRSPEDVTAHEPIPSNYHSHRNLMYRVQSSPSIYNLNGIPQSNQSLQQHSYSNCYTNSRQPHHQNYHSKPPVDVYKSSAPERPFSVRSVGRVEGSRYQVDQTPTHHFSCTTHPRGNGSCPKCMHYEDYSSWSEKRLEKGCSLPPSPLSLSPRAHSHISMAMRPWDNAISE